MPHPLSPRKRKAVLSTLVTLISTQIAEEGDSSFIPCVFTPPLDDVSEPRPHPEQGGERISSLYLARIPQYECIWRFRFTADELHALAHILALPNPLITTTGYHAWAIECIGLLCARLRSPEDQWSLATKYARSQSAISEITNETATYINATWSHLLGWDKEGVVSPHALRKYADALTDFGAPTSSVALFIDCTIRQMCRPGEWQELAYTGYKKYHGMKFQGLVAPNGLLVHLDGPYRAPQNDCGVLNLSKLLEDLEAYAIQPGSQEGDPPERRYFQVYGDSAYGVSPYMVSPYSGVAPLTPEQKAWNTAMGGVRISVEHGFGLVLTDWPFLQAFWKQKVWGTACGVMYRVAVLLTNAHSCVRPNQTAERYNCAPPTLEEYFHR